MAFSLRTNHILHKIIDSTAVALNVPSLPSTLGSRPQVFPLRFAASDSTGSFLEPGISSDGVSIEGATTIRHGSRVHRPGSSEWFIGETISMIYFPVASRGGVLHDVLFDRPLAGPADALSGCLPPHRGSRWTVGFVPTLCPNCGWDLEGEPDSLVLTCRNCGSAWECAGEQFKEVDFLTMPQTGDEDIFLPFWKIRAKLDGIKPVSGAVPFRLAGIRGFGYKEREEDVCRFLVPAFKIQPRHFLRLARSMTSRGFHPVPHRALPRSALYPVTLPRAEAVESLRVILASMAVPTPRTLGLLTEMAISPVHTRLLYCPFIVRGSECIQPDMQIGMSRHAMYWGRLI